MPRTEKGLFYVDVVNTTKYKTDEEKKDKEDPFSGKVYPSRTLRDGKTYICIDKDDSFRVQLQTADNGDKRHYGASLYIDGVRVKGKKTFKARSNFFGFK